MDECLLMGGVLVMVMIGVIKCVGNGQRKRNEIILRVKLCDGEGDDGMLCSCIGGGGGGWWGFSFLLFCWLCCLLLLEVVFLCSIVMWYFVMVLLMFYCCLSCIWSVLYLYRLLVLVIFNLLNIECKFLFFNLLLKCFVQQVLSGLFVFCFLILIYLCL